MQLFKNENVSVYSSRYILRLIVSCRGFFYSTKLVSLTFEIITNPGHQANPNHPAFQIHTNIGSVRRIPIEG